MIEGKRREKMLDELIKWLEEGQVTNALEEARDSNVWKVMIAYA